MTSRLASVCTRPLCCGATTSWCSGSRTASYGDVAVRGGSSATTVRRGASPRRWVWTGWFLDRCEWPVETPQITLVDLNENSLSVASKRIAATRPRRFKRMCWIRSTSATRASTRSVRITSSIAFPASSGQRVARVASSACPYLTPGGVFFGSTILGRDVPHNLLGRRLMRLYNRKGIFSNLADDQRGTRGGARVSTDRRRGPRRQRRCAVRRSAVTRVRFLVERLGVARATLRL